MTSNERREESYRIPSKALTFFLEQSFEPAYEAPRMFFGRRGG